MNNTLFNDDWLQGGTYFGRECSAHTMSSAMLKGCAARVTVVALTLHALELIPQIISVPAGKAELLRKKQ